MKKLDFSVVVPVYNSERSLRELHERLETTFRKMDKTFEVVFVNDGSSDGSLAALQKLHAAYDNVRVVDLYRNHGQHTALICGFKRVSGDIVVTIDDDLQHAPEDIPTMFEALGQDHDAVFGAYEKKRHGLVANLGSVIMRRVQRRLFRPPAGFRDSAFRLVRREVVDRIKDSQTPFPFVSAMILSVTDRVANAKVGHAPRRHGASGYTSRGRIRLSYNLLINYSALPLRFTGFVGLLASIAGFSVGLIFLVKHLLEGAAPPGWTTLVVAGSFSGALVFIMLFIVGEYLSRILREVSHGIAPSIRAELSHDPTSQTNHNGARPERHT